MSVGKGIFRLVIECFAGISFMWVQVLSPKSET